MPPQGVEYNFREPNAHEIIFHNASVETFEVFFTLFDTLFISSDPNQPLRLLIVSNLDMPPVSYLVAQHQRMRERYAKLALRVAVLHPPSTQASVISTLIHMVNSSINLRMFTAEHRDEAMAWLTR